MNIITLPITSSQFIIGFCICLCILPIGFTLFYIFHNDLPHAIITSVVSAISVGWFIFGLFIHNKIKMPIRFKPYEQSKTEVIT